ncbi:hypothetical protein CDD81_5989 [Ophiocordyceps australis]|uniref:Heme oxygenase-like protein n=1 Tax=Ophiocordyceps australis TaxID=1399860 RepID=A0A2C5XI17_9HYPO|nr:hypothetical protein CDD81_5989 [Ophiocordyceps australis]
MSACPFDSFKEDRPLADSIVAATRSVHAQLNKLVVARLPMALPPYASDPSLYLTGLLHIAPIYLAFEQAWKTIIDSPACQQDAHHGSQEQDVSDDQHLDEPRACPRVRALLSKLYTDRLMRSGNLRSDIAFLTRWPADVVDEELRSVSQTGRVANTVHHIRRTCAQRPHVVIAYSYIMFMALFAGGRFIRATLESPGDKFWQSELSSLQSDNEGTRSKVNSQYQLDITSAAASERGVSSTSTCFSTSPSMLQSNAKLPLSLFDFDSEMDGEDLKREFKKCLAESECELTTREKHDIVQESVCIFENVIAIVGQLDIMCAATTKQGPPKRGKSILSLAGLLKNPLGIRFRDSVVITKERRDRSSSKRSEDHDPEFDAQAVAMSTLTSDGHLHGNSAHNLCPASKAVRFQKAPPHARHSGSFFSPGCLQIVQTRFYGYHVGSWALAMALSIIMLGAIFAGGRVGFWGS